GLDRSGDLIMAWARPQQPVALVRLTASTNGLQSDFHLASNIIATLPTDILPGNILGMGSDGVSVECERVLSWQPLHTLLVRISLTDNSVSAIAPLFTTSRFGTQLTPLNRSSDGHVLVMSQVMSLRQDLAIQGITGVPAQEALLIADANTGAT